MFPSHLIIHPCCYIILLSFSNAWYRLLLRLKFSLRVSFLIAVVLVAVVVAAAAVVVVLVVVVILKFISASFRHHVWSGRNRIEFKLEKEGLPLVILPHSYSLEQFFFFSFAKTTGPFSFSRYYASVLITCRAIDRANQFIRSN